MPAPVRRRFPETARKPLPARWAVVAAAPLLGLLWLSGCENTWEYAHYPKELVYPLRTDPIVDSGPGTGPFAPPGPGHLDEEISQINSLGGRRRPQHIARPRPERSNEIDPRPHAQRRAAHACCRPRCGRCSARREPRVGGRDGEDAATVVKPLVLLKVRDAAADAPFKTLAQGSKVFRYHCVHCHGLTGDGRGPTGPWVVPHPRNYRSGEFKFISTKPEVNLKKPHREVLLRTLRNGIENTSMPSFALLDIRDPESKDKESDLEAVVSYVIHLSIRGQVELNELKALTTGSRYVKQVDADGKVHEALEDAIHKVHDGMVDVVSQWAESNPAADGTDPNLMTPPPDSYDKKMSSHDRDELHSPRLRPLHRPQGRSQLHQVPPGLGRQTNFLYDHWGTLVRPMNLTTGVYRGGRRPIDLYWRVKGGVTPSTMPKTGMDDKQIWDVVNFVHALPYPQMLPEDVRMKVYDAPPDEDGKAERAEK